MRAAGLNLRLTRNGLQVRSHQLTSDLLVLVSGREAWYGMASYAMVPPTSRKRQQLGSGCRETRQYKLVNNTVLYTTRSLTVTYWRSPYEIVRVLLSEPY
jgi:hypothetical protein